MNRLAGPWRRRRPLANFRRLLFEPCEARRLLTSDWQNPDQRQDANDDLFVSPVDALNLRRPILSVELSNDTAAGGARNSDRGFL